MRMRWNEADVAALLDSRTPDWEGRLTYKPPKSSSSFALAAGYKERYFKLVGNLLFCLRLGPDYRGDNTDPVAVLLVENCTVSRDTELAELSSFSIVFRGEENTEKRHSFVAESSRSVTQWLEALQGCSYEAKREQLILLQIRLRDKTGQDPLRGTTLEHNPCYVLPSSPTWYTSLPSEAAPQPQPPPRKLNKINKSCQRREKCDKSSGFTSHLGITNWETVESVERPEEALGSRLSSVSVPSRGSANPTFKSHVAVPEDKLIDI